MKRLQLPAATAILVSWIGLSVAAVVNPQLVPLATASVPVALLPAGWLFTSELLDRRRNGRSDD